MDLYSSVSSVSCASGTNAWTITGTISLEGAGPGDMIFVGSRSFFGPSTRGFRIATINRDAKTFTTTDNADTNYVGVPFWIDFAGSGGVGFLSGQINALYNLMLDMFGIGSSIFAGGGSRFLLRRQTGTAAIAELMFALRSGDVNTGAFYLRQRQVDGVEVLDFISTTDGTTEVVVFRITRAGVVSFPSSLTTSALQANNLNGGPLGGIRNVVVNGAFDLWQRGNSGFTSGTFGPDRWLVDFVTTAQRSTDVPDTRFQYSMEFGNSSASFPMIQQRIPADNCRHLFNRPMNLSFWAKNVSGTAPLIVYTAYGNATDTFGSPVLAFYQDSTALTSAWVRYSFSLGLTAANVNNGYQVQLFRATSSAATTRITGVQLEPGPVATAYEFMGDRGGRTVEMLRAMSMFETGVVRSENGSRYIPFKVRKRATPTVTVSAGTAANITVDGFELSHTTAADITYTSSADL